MKFRSKQIITILILVSFLTIVVFGVFSMMHGSQEQMAGNCPLSAMGQSLCPQDILSVVIHHISAYYAFLNIPINSGITILIISLLLYIFAISLVFIYLLLFIQPIPSNIFYNSPLINSYNRKINHWLSLFENSPSKF